MKNLILASRYLNAFSDSIDDKDALIASLSSLSELVDVVSNSVELNSMLYSPIISIEHKKNLITPLLDKYDNKVLKNFVLLLVKKKRLMLLHDINRLIPLEINKINNVLEVRVESSTEFSDEDKRVVHDVLSKRFNKTIKPVFKNTNEILGGFKVIVGDTIYDGTLENSLSKFKSSLKQKQR